LEVRKRKAIKIKVNKDFQIMEMIWWTWLKCLWIVASQNRVKIS